MEAASPLGFTGQSFCHRCGAGVDASSDQRFCGSCGAALLATPPPAARYLRRMTGLAVDWVVIGVPMAALFIWADSLEGPDAPVVAGYLVAHLLIYGTPFLYWALLPRVWGGRTIGRRVCRTRLVRVAVGVEVTYLRALGRAFIIVPMVGFLIPVLVDLLFPLFGRHQSIADRATDTLVVRDA